ncbi:hypothetical protein P775_06645 [Puniceibacterium antarcticum]|uniref:Uncharacterized protein n=1 Tax=Puniceibacterium antarcticum TaxID=1206336 RepID=A0A2G8RHQ5_9RHOB|nr:hypothetical protein P775_06645 [Puniceibacterium antarcticum]
MILYDFFLLTVRKSNLKLEIKNTQKILRIDTYNLAPLLILGDSNGLYFVL